MSTLTKKRETGFPLLSDFFGDEFFNLKNSISDWSPAVNVVENEDSFDVEVAAPGIRKDEFELSVENGVLTIKGKNEKEEEEKKKNYTRKEFSSRSFIKSLTLPENTDKESIKAKHEDGVLKITFKKSPQVENKKTIAID